MIEISGGAGGVKAADLEGSEATVALESEEVGCGAPQLSCKETISHKKWHHPGQHKTTVDS